MILYCVVVITEGVRRYLDATQVARAVQMIEDGVRRSEVARSFDVSRSVVQRLWTRYQETDGYTRRPGQGRNRITTARQDRYVVTSALRNRFITARALQNDLHHASGVRVSNQTVRNRLHEDRLRARRPATGVILNRQHRRARLEFALEHQNWQLAEWSNILFTNESRYTVSNNDGRMRVWRRQGQRFAACNMLEVDSYGGGAVVVWVESVTKVAHTCM